MPTKGEKAPKPRRTTKTGEPDRRGGSPPGIRGNAPYERDEKLAEMVKAMAGYGMRDEDIAKAMQIGETTLKVHYRPELDHGRGTGIANAVQTFYQMAVGEPKRDGQGKPIPGQWVREPSEKSLHLFLMNRAGFAQRHEHSGPGGRPIETKSATLSLDDATDDELDALERFFGRKIAESGDQPD